MNTRMGVAQSVAAALRAKILSGELSDGEMLPRYDDLLVEFGISKPTLREAMKILESEGLVRIVRGSAGGAVVQTPRDSNIAYVVGLVLESGNVALDDVSSALEEIEPICARFCAARPDRHEVVIPRLEEVHAAAMAAVDDDTLTATARRFHEELVACCGNRTLTVVAGALVKLWSSHESDWAHHGGVGLPTAQQRTAGLRAHERLIQLIADGDVDRAGALAHQHLADSQRAALQRTSQRLVAADAVRASNEASATSRTSSRNIRRKDST